MTIIWPNGTPTRPRVTSAFGPRVHPVTGKLQSLHRGVDLAGWSTIVSPVTGVVTRNEYQAGGAGNWLEVKEHSTGDRFRFFHLKHRSPLAINARVVAGSALGVMGKTGTATAVHLHLEVWPGGRSPIDPLPYFARRLVGAPTPTPSKTPPPKSEEDDDMTENTGMYAESPDRKTVNYQVSNLGSGACVDFNQGPGAGPYPLAELQNLAIAYKLANGGFFKVPQGNLDVNRLACEKVRLRQADKP